MPFLLRRTKDEVLSDLPEKIIQDRFCDLSPVQLKLYEQFSGSHVRQEISSMVKLNESADTGGRSDSPRASTHVFQVILLFILVCDSIFYFLSVSSNHIMCVIWSFRHFSTCLNSVVIHCLFLGKKFQIPLHAFCQSYYLESLTQFRNCISHTTLPN